MEQSSSSLKLKDPLMGDIFRIAAVSGEWSQKVQGEDAEDRPWTESRFMMLPDVAGARDRSLNVMTAAEEACEM